jgi:hypothetical protein
MRTFRPCGAYTMNSVQSYVKATDAITVDRQWSVRLRCSVKFT